MEDIVRSQLRVPSDLHDQLKECAERSGRSLNAEIVFRLTESLGRAAAPPPAGNSKADDLAERLSNPAHREELRALLDTLYRLAGDELPKKKRTSV